MKVYFNDAVHQLKAEAKRKQIKKPDAPDFATPKGRTRKLALQWAALSAKQEFRDYGERMSDHGKRLVENKKNPCGAFIVVIELSFDGVFGSIDAVVSATANAVHGLSGLINPSWVIKKSKLPYVTIDSSTSSEKDHYSVQKSDTAKKKKKKKVKKHKKIKTDIESKTVESGGVSKKKKAKKEASINVEGAELNPKKPKRKKKEKIQGSVSKEEKSKSAQSNEKSKSGKSVDEMSEAKVQEKAGEIVRQLEMNSKLSKGEVDAFFSAIYPGTKLVEDLVMPDLSPVKAQPQKGFFAWFNKGNEDIPDVSKKTASIEMEDVDAEGIDVNEVLEQIDGKGFLSSREKKILQRAIQG